MLLVNPSRAGVAQAGIEQDARQPGPEPGPKPPAVWMTPDLRWVLKPITGAFVHHHLSITAGLATAPVCEPAPAAAAGGAPPATPYRRHPGRAADPAPTGACGGRIKKS